MQTKTVVISSFLVFLFAAGAVTVAAIAYSAGANTTLDEADTASGIPFEQDLAQVDEADMQNHAANLDITSTSELSDDELADLQFMREEEKLAHDVYTMLYEEWGLQIFANISDSEQKHTDSIRSLLDAYSVSDIATNTIGEFSNQDLQDLYTQLIADGSESEQAALQVGALIEDVDIVDLEDAMARTENEAILTVYENLQKGSRNHLRSFTDMLNRYGETYEPQYLTESEYLSIITDGFERGGGNGNGRGGK